MRILISVLTPREPDSVCLELKELEEYEAKEEDIARRSKERASVADS
jgi:hypothetical protein